MLATSVLRQLTRDLRTEGKSLPPRIYEVPEKCSQSATTIVSTDSAPSAPEDEAEALQAILGVQKNTWEDFGSNLRVAPQMRELQQLARWS